MTVHIRVRTRPPAAPRPSRSRLILRLLYALAGIFVALVRIAIWGVILYVIVVALLASLSQDTDTPTNQPTVGTHP